jgi:hypothetical protein
VAGIPAGGLSDPTPAPRLWVLRYRTRADGTVLWPSGHYGVLAEIELGDAPGGSQHGAIVAEERAWERSYWVLAPNRHQNRHHAVMPVAGW